MQIREEEKKIGINDLACYLGVSEARIIELINDGFLPQGVNNGRLHPRNLLTGMQKGGIFPAIELNGERKKYFLEIINSVLVIEQGGLFVVPSEIYPSKYAGLAEMIKEYGLWNAQSLNNQIRIKDIVCNPVHQIILANEILEAWKKKISIVCPSRRCVVYWKGTEDSTLCLYLMGDRNCNFFEKYDAHLGIENVNVSHIGITDKE